MTIRLLRPPVDVDAGRRSHSYVRRVDHRNQCDRLYGVEATFVLHSKHTDFGGRDLPEYPIFPIVRPTRYNYMMGNRIVQILSIVMLCNDCRTDTL